MNTYEMFRKVSSSRYYDQMLKYLAPLNEHLGINHFWYYRITLSGYYSYVGMHTSWDEFCFDHDLLSHFPCLRHPRNLKSGISLMKATEDNGYKKVLQTAWKKFNINFSINLQKQTPEGMEAFGFASRFNDPKADERIINELSLLNQVIKTLKKKHTKIFHILDDYQVDLNTQFGSRFYENPKEIKLCEERSLLLKKMGVCSLQTITPQEKNVLKFILHGYPASYIASQLKLKPKTIENYLANIKCKLACTSKVELIQKAQEFEHLGFFDLMQNN